MSNSAKPKPWFEDAAALTKLHYTGVSDVAEKTEQRILELAARKRRFPPALWLVPGIIAGSASLAWAEDVVRWTLEQVHTLVDSPEVSAEFGDSQGTAAAPRSSESAVPLEQVVPAVSEREVVLVPQQARSGVSTRQRRGTSAPVTAVSLVEPPSDLAMYRLGHTAQFERRDNAAALAAWDAYLKDVPGGRFTPEVRYNRAQALAGLGRKAEALRALAPFASGAYGPLRQKEAQTRIDALKSDR